MLAVTVGLVDRMENLGRLTASRDVLGLEQLFESRPTRRVPGVDGESLAVRRQGAARFPKAFATEIPELGEQREPLFADIDDVEVRFIGVPQILKPRRTGIERLEGHEGLRARTELFHDGAPRIDGLRFGVELAGKRLRRPPHEIATFAWNLRAISARFEDLDEFLPLPGPLVQAVESGERGRIGRILVEARFPGSDGAVEVVEYGFAQRPEPTFDFLADLGAFFQPDLRAERVAQLLVRSGRDIESFERAGRRQRQRGVVGIEVEDLSVGLLGFGGISELILVDPRDLGQDLALHSGRVGAGAGALEHLGDTRLRAEPPTTFE